MGVVYEVQDRGRNEIVALKTMLRARAEDVFRLKREFSQPGGRRPSESRLAVRARRGRCELLLHDGAGARRHARDFVRGSASDGRAVASGARESVARAARARPRRAPSRGKLHRDIKPSNVLVTAQGRVVISRLRPHERRVYVRFVRPASLSRGTPAYLAPERHAGAPPTQEADWYGVGVTLYEAVAGYLPAGPSFDDLPDDLAVICRGLLEHDPAERMSGSEVWRLLHGQDAPHANVAMGPEPEAAFVGRREPLETLAGAWRQARSGQAVTVCVHGPSGIRQERARRVVPCAGVRTRGSRRPSRPLLRNESVPYKALDGVVDHLSQLSLRDAESGCSRALAIGHERVIATLPGPHAGRHRGAGDRGSDRIRSGCGSARSAHCASCSPAWRPRGRS
jgi:serine/threonine protein kinase